LKSIYIIVSKRALLKTNTSQKARKKVDTWKF